MPEQSFSIPELAVPITFRRRPISIPAELRPHWLIAIIILILWQSSRAAKASLQKLHVLSWAVRDLPRQQTFLRFLNEEIGPEDVLVRYEPGLDRAVRLAVADALISSISGHQVQLTPTGSAIAQQIEQTADCMEIEKTFLTNIGLRPTEKRIKALLHMESAA